MDLSNLIDEGAELVERIGGMEFKFSEISLPALARLQNWIRATVPHPIEALKPHLDGLPDHERERLLDAARIEARNWPPEVGTPEGAMALLGREAGQVEALYEGLQVHHPDATRDDAWKIYRVLKREVVRENRRSRGESPRVRRIYAVLFGTLDAMEEDEVRGVPKGVAPAVASHGKPLSVGANGN